MIEIYETPTGWRWRVKGNNGEIVASGESYTTRMAALEGVATLGRILHEKPEIKFIEGLPLPTRRKHNPGDTKYPPRKMGIYLPDAELDKDTGML